VKLCKRQEVKMSMPGFSAEVSSYKTNVHYRSMPALAQADGVIFQQFPSQA
jgi:hypothetical protein